MYEMKGHHYFAVFYNCTKNVDTLNDKEKLEEICKECLERGNIKSQSITSKQFPSQGITLMIIITESHFAIHTYPELKGFTVDIQTCGKEGHPGRSIDVLQEYFEPEEVDRNYFTF